MLAKGGDCIVVPLNLVGCGDVAGRNEEVSRWELLLNFVSKGENIWKEMVKIPLML